MPETGATLMGYDGAGNLAWSAAGLAAGTAGNAGGTTPAILARKVSRSYDARNRLKTLTFPDSDGNQLWTYAPDSLPTNIVTTMLSDGRIVTNQYSYNRRRLPATETQKLTNWGTYAVTRQYNANGHLASRVYPAGFLGSVVDYAPNALGQPTKAGTFTSAVTYYPNGAIKSFTYGNGLKHTLTQNVRGLPVSIRYQHTDALGSPVAVSNETKAVVERTAYGPYGWTAHRALRSGPGYTGHHEDAATGLVYMQQRYYDPQIGVFLSIDLVTAYKKPETNCNRYWYATDNPYRLIDPDGRNGVTVFGGLLTETWNAVSGRGFDGNTVMGALKDGYDGEGDGFTMSAFQDVTSFVPARALVGSVGKIGVLAREASLFAKTAEGTTRIRVATLHGGALGRTEIAATRAFGKKFVKNNGASAYVTRVASGNFNAAFFGEMGGGISRRRSIFQRKSC